MKIKLLFGAIAVLALLATAYAADVTGKWVAQMPGRDGGTSEITFNFKAQGNTLTGTMSNQMGETEITEGKVDGDNISFVVVRKMGENEFKTTWKGVVSGDEIKLTREFAMPPGGMGGPGAGGPPGGGQGGQGGGRGPGREIVAKRVK